MSKKKLDRKALLKTIPNYAKNVTKSVMFSSRDIFKEITPEIAEFTESTARITQEAISDARQSSVNFQNYIKNMKNSQTMKDINRAKSDLVSDLKTGKFYNVDRSSDRMDANMRAEDEAMFADMGLDDFNMDDFRGDDEAIIAKLAGGAKSKDSSSSQSVVNNVSINKVNTMGSPSAMLQGIAQSSRLSAGATVAGTQLIVDNQNTIHGIQSLNTSRMFTEVSSRLTEMTGYLKGLYEYTGTMDNYIKATMEYYDTTVTANNTMQAMQKEMIELSRKAYGISEDNGQNYYVSEHASVLDKFTPAKYLEHVKKNTMKALDDTGAGSILSMFGTYEDMAGEVGNSALGTLLDSPGKFISNALAKKLVVNPIKDSAMELNNTFKSFFKGASLKGRRILHDKNNEGANILADILGVKADEKIKLGNGEFKAVGFGMESQLALTEVIPTYLRKILKAITNDKDEYVYDYTSKKFKTISSLETETRNLENDARLVGSYDIRSKINKNIDSLSILSRNDKAYYKDKVVNFLNYLNDEEMFFDPTTDTYESMRDRGMYDINKDDFNAVKSFIQSIGQREYIKLNDMVYNTRESYNNFATNYNNDLFSTGYSALYNGIKSSTQSSTVGKATLGIDKYGLSAVDYLSDIKAILMEGIMVYGLKPTEGFTRDANITQQYSTRLQNYRNMIKKLDDSQSSVPKDKRNDVIPEPNQNTIDKLLDLSSDDIKEFADKADRAFRSSGSGDRIVNVPEPNSKLGVAGQLLSIPHKLANAGIKTIDRGLKSVLYGKVSNDGLSFMESIKVNITNGFDKANEYLRDKIMNPLEEKLFGEKGIMTKFDNWLNPKLQNVGGKIKSYLFGDDEKEGKLSGLMNRGKNLFNKGKRYVTGKGYIDAQTGEIIEDTNNSAWHNIKDIFNKSKDKISISLFGNTDDNTGKRKGGFIGSVKDTVNGAVNSFKDKYLGNVGDVDVKEMAPKVLSGMGLGAIGSLFSTLFLPLGIGVVPAMLLGGAAGFVNSNDRAKEFLFGEEGLLGKNGPKAKAAIEKYAKPSITGLGLGGVLGAFTGNPLLGPILGASIGFASKSDKFKTFMFGTEDDDSEAIIKKATMDKIKKALPGAAAIGAGTFLYSNLGLLGSSLLPGGVIGASLFGFASSLALQSDSVKRFLFGEKDEEGQITKDGVLGKVGTWFKYNFIEEIKMRMWSMTNRMGLWFRDKIGNNLQKAFKPMIEEVKLMGKNIVGFFGKAISNTFEKSVGVPLKDFTQKHILDPMKKVFGGLFNGFKKVIELPFNMIGKAGTNLAKKHQRQGLAYTEDYFAGVEGREAKLRQDRAKFEKDEKNRRGKLSFLQSVMSKYGYDRSKKEVIGAMDDFNNKYKGDKWKEYEIASYKSLNSIDMQSVKQTSLLDSISSIMSEVGADFKVLTSHLKTYLPDISDLSNKVPKAKVGKTSRVKTTGDILNETANEVMGKMGNIKNMAINPTAFLASMATPWMLFGQDAKTMFKDIRKLNVKESAKAFRANIAKNFRNNAKEMKLKNTNGEVVNMNVATGEESILDDPDPEEGNIGNIKEPRMGKVNSPKQPRTKTIKYKSSMEKDIASIKVTTKAIDREISGQLDGVGWNLDSIRKMLASYFGLDIAGENIKRGNKSRSIFNRIRNAVMRPFDFITDKVSKAVDSVTSGVKNTLSAVGKGISGVFKLFTNTLTGVAKGIAGTAKFLGQLTLTTAKTVGTIVDGAVKGIGKITHGILKGLGSAIGSTIAGLGKIVGGLGSAIGNVISGLGSLTKGLLKASSEIVKGVVNVTKSIGKTLFSTLGVIGKGLMNAISAPFAMMGNVAGRAVTKFTGKEKGKPVRVINNDDLFKESHKNPMHVIVVGDWTKDGNGIPAPNNFLNANKAKKTKSTITEPSATIDGKVIDVDFVSNGTNTSKTSRKKVKRSGDPKRDATRILANANNEVNAYAEKIANIKDYNFTADAARIDEIEGKTGQLVMANSMAQSTAASKGMFSLLAKSTKKNGLLGKIGTLLLFGFPKVFKWFKNIFSMKGITKLFGGLFGRGSLLGKGISSIAGLLTSGFKSLVGVIGSGFKLLLNSKFVQKGIDLGKKGLNFVKDKTLQGFGYLKGKAGKGLGKVKGKFGLGRSVANNAGAEAAEAVVEGLSNRTNRGASGKLKGRQITSAAGKVRGGKAVKRGKSGKVNSLMNLGANVLGNAVGGNNLTPANIDLSNIEDAIVINGNAVIQVNGSVLAGGAIGGGAQQGGVLDAASDLIESGDGKLSNKLKNSKVGKKFTNSKIGKKLGGGKLGKYGKMLGGSVLAGGALTFGSQLLTGNANEDSAEDFVRQTSFNFANKVANSRVVENAAGNVVEGVVSNQNSILKMISGKMDDILKSDFFVKGFGKHLKVIPQIGQWLMKKFSKLAGKRLTTLFTKMAKKATALIGGGAVSFGVIPGLFLGWDAVTGAAEARRIFKLGADAKVTIGMRTASGLAKLVDNNLTFGFIDITEIANFIYNIIGKDENKEMLANNQQSFEQQYQQYAAEAEANGEEVKSFDQWNSDQNKSVFGKAWGGIKSGFKSVGNGIKNFFGFGSKEEKEEGDSSVVPGLVAGTTAVAGSALLGSKMLDSNVLSGTQVGLDTAAEVINRDARMMYGDYETKYRNLNAQIADIDELRKRSDILIDKSQKATDMSITKAGDAIKNTVGLYSDVASTAMGSTMTMAGMNAEVGGNAYATTGSSVSAPVQKQSGGLWNNIKQTTKNIFGGVKKFFGFGNGPDDNDTSSSSTGGSSAGTVNANKRSVNAEIINGMVYFNQREEPWGAIPYTSRGDKSQTIGTSGCGPTSAAMVVSTLTGKLVTPDQACSYAVKNGFRTPNSGTSWGFFNKFGSQYGVGFSQHGGKDKNALQVALRNRQPVILSGQGGAPYTRGGHYVVAAGISGDGNHVIINDPNKREYIKSYPISQLLGSTLQMFVADKSLTGAPPISGSASVDMSGANTGQQMVAQESNSPLDIITKIGNIISGATASVVMGKMYTGELEQQQMGGANAFTGNASGSYNGAAGTGQLANTIAVQYAPEFQKAGQKYGVEPEVMQAISMQESGGNVRAGYTSRPAWGMMQIENTLNQEFADFGRKEFGQAFSPHDKIVPEKAIPFGTYKVSNILKHYNGDYMKAIQAYNFSHYSLDALIKATGNNWMNERKNIALYNGHKKRTGSMSYGDPEYIEHVMRYYKGTAIKTGTNSSVPGNRQEANAGGDYKPIGIRSKTKSSVPANNQRLEGNSGGGVGPVRRTITTPTISRQPIGLSKGTSSSVTPRPNSVDMNRIASSALSSMTNRIDDAMLARKIADDKISRGQSADLSAIMAYLEAIANNTSDIADSNREIASKDFCENHYHGTETNETTTNNNDNTDTYNNRPQSSNPFNSVNGAMTGAISRGYQQAKALSSR